MENIIKQIVKNIEEYWKECDKIQADEECKNIIIIKTNVKKNVQINIVNQIIKHMT